VCSRLIEVAKTSENKRRDIALTGRKIITCDFCDKRGHEAGRCWKNSDKPHNRLDSSSDAGPSRINKHKKNAAKVAKESKSAARASIAYQASKRPDSTSNESGSSDEDSDARRFRLTPHTPCRRRCALTQLSRVLCVTKDETSVDIMRRRWCCNFLRKSRL
jgi:hypothetical protein